MPSFAAGFHSPLVIALPLPSLYQRLLNHSSPLLPFRSSLPHLCHLPATSPPRARLREKLLDSTSLPRPNQLQTTRRLRASRFPILLYRRHAFSTNPTMTRPIQMPTVNSCQWTLRCSRVLLSQSLLQLPLFLLSPRLPTRPRRYKKESHCRTKMEVF